jgi:hypothetical protein
LNKTHERRDYPQPSKLNLVFTSGYLSAVPHYKESTEAICGGWPINGIISHMTNKPNQSAVQRSLQVMLRPIARLCLRHGLAVHELTEALKSALVSVAETEIQNKGEKVNVSRVSVATGIHRKDVARIQETGSDFMEPVNLVSRLVSTWESTPQFCTKGGKPRVLGTEGADSDFAQLVRLVTKDVHPRGVLLQLDRLNMVEHTANGLKLVAGNQNVRHDLGKAYHVLAQDLEDLSLAVEHNIHSSDETPHLHARTEFDNVFVDAIPSIRLWLLKEGSEFHKRAREFLSGFDQDLNPHVRKEAGMRISLTSFVNVEDKKR